MKNKYGISVLVLLICTWFSSCKKEPSNVSNISNNRPTANAGADQIIVLPKDSAMLDGSASTDPDNNITGFVWTKIAGPLSFNIASPNDVRTKVSNLAHGVYAIELKVTDAGGLFSRDTIVINVFADNIIHTDSTIVFTHLSQGPTFEEIDWAIRESAISLPWVTNLKNVFVKWNSTMAWYEIPICRGGCTPNLGFATFYDQSLQVFLSAALTDLAFGNSNGNYIDFIDVKVIAN